MVFLLNKRYKPYYKWMHRAMLTLPVLGEEVGSLIKELAENGVNLDAWDCEIIPNAPQALNSADRNVLLIEQICRLVADELRREGDVYKRQGQRHEGRQLILHCDRIRSKFLHEFILGGNYND